VGHREAVPGEAGPDVDGTGVLGRSRIGSSKWDFNPFGPNNELIAGAPVNCNRSHAVVDCSPLKRGLLKGRSMHLFPKGALSFLPLTTQVNSVSARSNTSLNRSTIRLPNAPTHAPTQLTI
jgi:hypothetical protein